MVAARRDHVFEAAVLARLDGIERAQSRRSTAHSGFWMALFESGAVDGVLRPGDVITATLGAAGTTVMGAGMGVGAALLAHVWPGSSLPGPQIGAALGLIVGCWCAGERIVRDLRYIPTWDVEDPPVEIEPAAAPPSYGVPVSTEIKHGPHQNTVLRGSILPELETHLVERKLHQVATAVLRAGWNLSKRQAGQFFGDDFKQVRDELLRLGLLVPKGKGPNAGFELTSAGKTWLEKFL